MSPSSVPPDDARGPTPAPPAAAPRAPGGDRPANLPARRRIRIPDLGTVFGPPASGLSSRRAWGLAAGAVLLGAVAETWRQTGVSPLDSLWAEDGGAFLQQALSDPLPGIALVPYGGYAQLAPRLVAAVAATVPLPFAAVVLSGGGALVVSMLAVFVYYASSGLIRSSATRAALAAAVVLAPIAPFEMTNNVETLHYYLLFGAFWALLWLPRGWGGSAAASLVIVAAALSDPLAILLLPLGVARILAVPRGRQWLPSIAGVVALTLQVAIVVANRDQVARGVPNAFGPGAQRPGLEQLAALYSLRVVIAPLLGPLTADSLWRDVGWLAAVIGAVGIAGLLVFAARSPAVRNRGFVLFLVAGSMAFFAAGFYLRWRPQMLPVPGNLNIEFGSRYTLVPILLLVVAIAVAVDRPHPAWGARAQRVVRAGTAVAVVFAFGANFSFDNQRTRGPSWSGALAVATAQCAQSPSGAVAVPIAPSGWSVEIPCRRLLARR